MKACPFCAEKIQDAAIVCKHCGKELAPPAQASPAKKKTSPVAWGCLGVLVLLFLASLIPAGGSSSSSGSVSLPSVAADTATMAKFNQLQSGMTYEQAVQVIGAPGQEMSRSDLAGITTVMYQWMNPGGSNMNAMFQNGKLITKAQFGLR